MKSSSILTRESYASLITFSSKFDVRILSCKVNYIDLKCVSLSYKANDSLKLKSFTLMTYCNIHFRIKFFTNYYETVALLGNINELGNWSSTKPLIMKTSELSYPYWETEDPIKVPTGNIVLYDFRDQ